MVTLSKAWVTTFLGNTPTVTHAVTLSKAWVTKILGNTPSVTHAVTLSKARVTKILGNAVCLSMFSGEAGKRAKAYSPLTARELSSGEAAHAEEPKAEEELKAKEDAEAEDEGSTPSATVDSKVVVCAVPSIDMTCTQCVENVAIVHPFLTQFYSPPPALGAPLLTQDEDAGDTGRDPENPLELREPPVWVRPVQVPAPGSTTPATAARTSAVGDTG